MGFSMTMMTTRCLTALVLSTLFAMTASAQNTLQVKPPSTTTPPVVVPKDQVVYRSTNIFRYNPLGLITDNQIAWRHRLYKDDSVVLRDNFFGLGLTPQVSAGYARIGALFELQPLSVLRLWGNAEVVGYFGTFGLFQSFEHATSDYSDSEISRRGALPDGNALKNGPTYGTQLTAGADLQFKVGPIAARNLFRLVRGDYAMRDGDTVYYDQFYDVLAANGGAFVSNDTDILFITDFGLIAGLRFNTTMPFYGPEQFADGIVREHTNGPTLRGGPLVTYTFFDDDRVIWNKPTVLVSTQWYALHRWRTGADVSQLVPYVVVGLQFSGDLLKLKRE